MNIGCVLLAAGSGKRFGGNKLLSVVDGVPMAFHAIRLHADIPYARRVLVTQSSQTLLMEEAEKAGFAVAVNGRPDDGVAGSLVIGLSALLAEGDALDGALFSVCDQPYLTRETVRALTDSFCAHPGGIVAPCANGKRGNPVLFSKTYFDELLTLTGDAGGSQVIRRHPENIRLMPCGAREMYDIDRNDWREPPC